MGTRKTKAAKPGTPTRRKESAMWVRTTEHVPVLGGTAPRDGERGFEVRRVSRDRHLLTLWGGLGGRWADPLCRGLARAGLSIRSGYAVRHGSGESWNPWHARLEIVREHPSTDPVLLDYLELLARGRAPSDTPIELTDYALSESNVHGGSLFLEVRGPDRTGFLGGMLERLSFLSLTPVEMRIETRPDGVHDQLWLRTQDGELPKPRARKLLAEVLDGRLLR
jgi:hypothetical protein